MPALLEVAGRSAETADQKIAQPLLGAVEIVCRIHRSENVVAGHLPVERGDQPLETFLPNRLVNRSIVHVRILPCSAHVRTAGRWSRIAVRRVRHRFVIE